MCGICGIVARPGRPVRRIVESMAAAMVHRGPDAGGYRSVEFRDGVEGALGFRRLAVLDLSPAGNQPMVHPGTGDVLVFNGEIYNHEDLRRDLSAAGMLAYGAVQSPRTIWSHVRDFPAGHYQWIDERSVSDDRADDRRRFWSFASRPASTVPDAPSHVRDLLIGALERHVRADVPVGVFLSAGIDSTILATIAASLTPKVTAFTVGFEKALGEDEVVIAAATAHDLGMKHVSIVVETKSVFDEWRSWMESMDSPSIDGFNTALVSAALSREGVVVGLSGLGADELFGGYGTLTRVTTLQRSVRRSFVPGLVRLARATGIDGLLGKRTSFEKLVDIAAGDTDLATVFMGTRRVVSNRWLRGFGLDPGRLGLDACWLDRQRDECRPTLDGDDFNALSRLESTHYMRDTLLRDTDANSMRHSLEVRVPFLDLPLVDYVSALPKAAKTGGPGKSLLRRACADILPPAVLHRKKTGFTLPVGAWMVGPMRAWCESAVDALADAPGFEAGVVRRMWKDYLTDPKSMHWSRPLAVVVLGHHLASVRG